MSAAPDVVKEAVKEERKLVPIMPVRVKTGEAQRIIYHLTVDQHVIREDLKKPEFYLHIAYLLKPTYRIEVTNDEQTFFAEYLVIDAGKNWAVVEELRFVEFKKHSFDEKQHINYEVRFKGPHHKWCVVRKADQEPVKSQMGKEEANRALIEFVKNDNTPGIV